MALLGEMRRGPENAVSCVISHVTIISEQTLDVHREQEQHTPRQRHTAETAQARRQRTTENAQKTHRRAPIRTRPKNFPFAENSYRLKTLS